MTDHDRQVTIHEDGEQVLQLISKVLDDYGTYMSIQQLDVLMQRISGLRKLKSM